MASARQYTNVQIQNITDLLLKQTDVFFTSQWRQLDVMKLMQVLDGNWRYLMYTNHANETDHTLSPDTWTRHKHIRTITLSHTGDRNCPNLRRLTFECSHLGRGKLTQLLLYVVQNFHWVLVFTAFQSITTAHCGYGHTHMRSQTSSCKDWTNIHTFIQIKQT